MGKIAIVIFNDLKYCPYASFYAETFNAHGIDFDIISLSRTLSNNDPLSLKWKGDFSILSKITNFIRYKNFLKKKLPNYNFVIVLTTIPAVLMKLFLIKHFRNKYLVDIRDYTYEHNRIFKYLESKVLRFSALNFVSSPDFVKFLPKGIKYELIHNSNYSSSFDSKTLNHARDIIKIGYIGSINYFDQLALFCEKFANNKNIELHFYGNDLTNKLLDLLNKLNSDNIFYHGEYEPNEKPKIINSVDVLFNAYGNKTTLFKYAISNKYYDFLRYGKPLIVSSNTTMEKLSYPYCFSFNFDNQNIIDDFCCWYKNIDTDSLRTFIKQKMEEVICQNTHAKEILLGVIAKDD